MSHGGSPFSVILIVQALLAQLLWKTINNKTTVRGWRYTSIPEFSQRGNKRRDCLCLLHRSRLNEGGMGKTPDRLQTLLDGDRCRLCRDCGDRGADSCGLVLRAVMRLQPPSVACQADSKSRMTRSRSEACNEKTRLVFHCVKRCCFSCGRGSFWRAFATGASKPRR